MSPRTARRWPPTEPVPGGEHKQRWAAPGGEDEQLWAAVAEPSRRRVLDAILTHGVATPTLLARELPVSRQAITKHLAVLERAHLVAGHRQGREVRYVVDPQRLALATAALAQQAARWDQRLAAIKRLAEALHAAIAIDTAIAIDPVAATTADAASHTDAGAAIDSAADKSPAAQRAKEHPRP